VTRKETVRVGPDWHAATMEVPAAKSSIGPIPWLRVGVDPSPDFSAFRGASLPLINQISDSFIAQAASQFAAGQPVAMAQPVATYPVSQNLPGGLGPGVLLAGQRDRPYPQYSG